MSERLKDEGLRKRAQNIALKKAVKRSNDLLTDTSEGGMLLSPNQPLFKITCVPWSRLTSQTTQILGILISGQ